jgi:HAD superfamily hydrolase (TIGR01662 family)
VTEFTVVVPTLGRPSLAALLESLAATDGPAPAWVLLVDDRPGAGAPLDLPERLPAAPVEVLPGGGHGPAAARNVGWRAASTPWVVFLDDDVRVPPGWGALLAADLAAAPERVAGSQGRITVPVPARPTDWERNTAGLAGARWATADMAYRRAALLRLGGFDERFRRAYREDADLALRALRAGYELVVGRREVVHPVRPAGPWVSVAAQAGNADDALMRRKHGPGWRAAAGAPAGRLRWHLATVAAGAAAAGLAGRNRLAGGVPAAAWAGLTGWFAWSRIAPGPRHPAEVGTMLATSAAIPFAAAYHRARGEITHRRVREWRPPPRAVLFDRDGTLVVDVPYNGDPGAVRPVPGAAAALDRLRAAGIRVGVVTNQSGVARGLLSTVDVDAVNARVSELLGPFDVWAVCPHATDAGCGCRKPAPGLVHQALSELGVAPEDCAVVGDIGSDVGAALAAGARPVLVPTRVTRVEEVAAAPEVARDLDHAIDLLLGTRDSAGAVR